MNYFHYSLLHYVYTVVQIADFGMARDLEESEYYISQGGKVPVKWTAPEVGPHTYNALSTISCFSYMSYISVWCSNYLGNQLQEVFHCQ